MPPIPKNNNNAPFSIPTLFLFFIIISILSLTFFFFSSYTATTHSSLSLQPTTSGINVYVADLPRSLNYALLNRYWSFTSDSRISSDVDREIRSKTKVLEFTEFPPYPKNPIIKQYSAEYWIMGDLVTPTKLRTGSFAKRVFDERDADVVFVPFFATISAELQLGMAKGVFRKKVGNEDYQRQREVVDFVSRLRNVLNEMVLDFLNWLNEMVMDFADMILG